MPNTFRLVLVDQSNVWQDKNADWKKINYIYRPKKYQGSAFETYMATRPIFYHKLRYDTAYFVPCYSHDYNVQKTRSV